VSIIAKLFGSGRADEPMMQLDIEGKATIEQPEREVVLAAVLGLNRPSPTYLCLTHRNGDYLQAVGARPWCRVEMRVQTPLQHSCAFQDTPNPKYADGAKLVSGAGEITMAHDEWFLLKDAAEIFSAFYDRSSFPANVQWRSMNEMLDL